MVAPIPIAETNYVPFWKIEPSISAKVFRIVSSTFFASGYPLTPECSLSSSPNRFHSKCGTDLPGLSTVMILIE